MAGARAFVGTSGWNYRDWRGAFYPAEVRQAAWLCYLAERFSTVEINSSFYRIPPEETLRAWQKDTPKDFVFALKMWRGITHYKKLKDAGKLVQNFFGVANKLQPKHRGPLLIHLPPNQHKDADKLETFFGDMRRATSARWQIAVEFRHDSWLSEEIYNLLDRHNAALCLHDMKGQGAVEEPNDAGFVYLRRHGAAAAKYQGLYAKKQVEEDAERVRRWVKQGKTVYVYYNNDKDGNAVKNAAQLRDLAENGRSGQ